MSSFIKALGYGRSNIGFVSIDRTPNGDQFREISVNVRFEGAFEQAFTDGDNSSLLPTESMVNTVLSLAQDHIESELEVFGIAITNRFLAACPAASDIIVELREKPWERQISTGGLPPHTFRAQQIGGPVATIRGHRGADLLVSAGVREMHLLKSAHSGFTGFLRDSYTTIPDCTDRVLSVAVDAEWEYVEKLANFSISRNAIEGTLARTFGDHVSASSQQTLHRMGSAVLKQHPEVSQISLSCTASPTKMVDLEPFGRSNQRQIYVVQQDPQSVNNVTLMRE
jgi:urate oxidase